MTVDFWLPWLAGPLSGLVIVLVGLWANSKLGVNAAKDSLVRTLKDTKDVLEARMKLLEDENKDLRQRNNHLEQCVNDLEGKVRRLERQLEALRQP
jgi:predicted  nucleic acid-binding Zn-ribbon protein